MRYCLHTMPRKKKKDEEDSFLQRAGERFDAIPVRVREIVVGGLCACFGLFLLLSLINGAGSFGVMVREVLFVGAGDSPALLGWSFVLLIAFFFAVGGLLISPFRPLSQVRLWLGSVAALVSFGVLFSAGANEAAGGVLGFTVYSLLERFLGFFAYILIPLCVLGSLYILRLILSGRYLGVAGERVGRGRRGRI